MEKNKEKFNFKKFNFKKFKKDAYDFFEFKEMYTPKIVKIGYFLGVIILIIAFFYSIGQTNFFSSILALILANIVLRLFAELSLILFEINKKMK
ncbi:MAG: hypothetical protein PHT94_01515 [Candidatus Nanoarchaeia archaeon]|nr:hypothetical protein [Candidatus Nanoarchaeia archaeon]